MFHDKSLHNQFNEDQLFWTVNSDAAKLLGMLRYYRKMGQTVLPVAHLKRMGFTRRKWELATKGTRERNGSKLADPTGAPAKDGLEYHGVLSEVTIAQEGSAPKTYWVIGTPSVEAIEECSALLDEAIERANREKHKELQSDNIDADPKTERDELQQPVIMAENEKEQKRQEELNDAYDQGAAEQAPRAFEKGRIYERQVWVEHMTNQPELILSAMEQLGGIARCCKTASLSNNTIKGAQLEHCEGTSGHNLNAAFKKLRDEERGSYGHV